MSYGNGAGEAVDRSSIRGGNAPPQAAVEQLSSINDTTIHNLQDANDSLDTLLNKVRGSQPRDGATADKVPERHMMGDAYLVRELSSGVVRKINELHRIIGHEK